MSVPAFLPGLLKVACYPVIYICLKPKTVLVKLSKLIQWNMISSRKASI